MPYSGERAQRCGADRHGIGSDRGARTPDDLLAVPAVVEALAGHPRWAFVLTQTPRSRLVDGTLRHLAGLGRVAPVSLGFRQDYPAAAIEGKAAVDFATTKSADEVKQLRSYVISLLRDQHGKAAY